MSSKAVCFLCGLQAEYLPNLGGKDLIGISCKRCGEYYLDGLLATCGEPKEENKKKVLRGFIRWERELRRPAPIITESQITTIFRSYERLSDETKVDRLLLYYSSKHPEKGSDIEFISDPDYPITFSTNSVEFVYLLEKVACESLGYIKILSITSGGPPEGYFQILPRGWARLDWLRKIELADEKFELDEIKIISSLRDSELQLKEHAQLTGTRFSSPLARQLNKLYLQGSLAKLDKRIQIDSDILFGGRAGLGKKQLEILGERIKNQANSERDFLSARIGEIYRDCHAEGYLKNDITAVFSEIDRKLKSILIDLESEGLSQKMGRPAELPEIDIRELIKSDESTTLEFKSTFQWDIRQERENKELRKEVAITLAAFNNTEGGYLIIGVSDDRSIFGLEKDYSLLRHSNKRDYLLQTLCNIIDNFISREFAASIGTDFYEIDGKDIIRIKVSFGSGPVFVKESEKGEAFYIRTQNSEKRLSLSETISYVRKRWR